MIKKQDGSTLILSGPSRPAPTNYWKFDGDVKLVNFESYASSKLETPSRPREPIKEEPKKEEQKPAPIVKAPIEIKEEPKIELKAEAPKIELQETIVVEEQKPKGFSAGFPVVYETEDMAGNRVKKRIWATMEMLTLKKSRFSVRLSSWKDDVGCTPSSQDRIYVEMDDEWWRVETSSKDDTYLIIDCCKN